MPGKLEKFDIEFDNVDAVFYAGQQCVGKVIVLLKEPMQMRQIRLRLVGRVHASWPEQHKGKKMTNIHSGDETHFDNTVVLYPNQEEKEKHSLSSEDDKEKRKDAVTLHNGLHEFMFSFQLPEECPTSFEGTDGHCRYFVKATIDKPWKFDHNTKRAFTVINVHNLNLNDEAKKPVSVHQVKRYTKCCAKGGEIECTMQIPRSGYVSGEAIPVKLNIDNSSQKSVRKFVLELKQHAKYKASASKLQKDQKTRESEKVVSTLEHVEDLPPKKTRAFDQALLPIPPLPSALTSNVLEIKYHLIATVYPQGDKEIVLSTPITIGTVPYKELFNPHKPSPEYAGLQPLKDHKVPFTLPSTITSPLYGKSPLGAHRIHDDDDTEWVRGEMEFTPKYPAYYRMDDHNKSNASLGSVDGNRQSTHNGHHSVDSVVEQQTRTVENGREGRREVTSHTTTSTIGGVNRESMVVTIRLED